MTSRRLRELRVRFWVSVRVWVRVSIDNDNDLFRLGGLLGLYVDLYVSDSCLMTKHASTAPPQTQYYILHLLNGCSTINSTTVRLLGLLSDFS